MAQHVVLNEGDGLFLGALDGGQLTQALSGSMPSMDTVSTVAEVISLSALRVRS